MNERTRRTILIVGAIVVALLSIGAGALIAVSSEDGAAPAPSTTSTPSASGSPSRTPERSQSETPEPSEPSESETAILEDGRHLVYVDTAFPSEDGPARVRFDLVYFHTGAEAEEVAEEHGEDAPNGYYIENDNPRLRTLPLADQVEVAYVPEGRCCELQPGNVDAWLASVLQTAQTDYPEDAPWWITVEGGRITRIEEQFLP